MKSVIYNGKELFYVLERKKVKNINMRLHEDGTVYISANKSVPEDYIEKILLKNADKFFKASQKLKSRKNNLSNISSTKYLGKEYPVNIIESNENKIVFENDIFNVYTTDKNNRENILFLILKWKSDKCVSLYSDINRRVYELFKNAGYSVPLASVTIKLMKSRWGSCNYIKGRFSMNLRLIDYPSECIYGVFCHEYMHFIHQNHSKDFYNDLEKIFPEYKKYDKLLKF